jgi:hypothetical protein
MNDGTRSRRLSIALPPTPPSMPSCFFDFSTTIFLYVTDSDWQMQVNHLLITHQCNPLHSTPLHSTPLHSTPLHSTPLHSTPLHSTPLHSTAIACRHGILSIKQFEPYSNGDSTMRLQLWTVLYKRFRTFIANYFRIDRWCTWQWIGIEWWVD